MVNSMMGAPTALYDHLLSGGLAQIVAQLLRENLDMALIERTLNTIRASLEERPQPSRQFAMALFRHVGIVEQLMIIVRGTANHYSPSLANTISVGGFGCDFLGNLDSFQEQASSILRQHFGISADDCARWDSNRTTKARDTSIQVRIKRT